MTLLLLILSTASLPTQQLNGISSAHTSPPSCHANSPNPAPQPSNHICCQAGHASAILQFSLLGAPLFIEVAKVVAFSQKPSLESRLRSSGSQLILPAEIPPVTIPLLI
jgi:hypothetical protein